MTRAVELPLPFMPQDHTGEMRAFVIQRQEAAILPPDKEKPPVIKGGDAARREITHHPGHDHAAELAIRHLRSEVAQPDIP